MRLQIYKAAILFASVLSALSIAFAVSAPAGTARVDYEAPEYVTHLTATTMAGSWRSPQRWKPSQIIFIQPWVHGKEVPGTGGNGSCKLLFAGKGLVARVNVCGQSAVPIRIRYRSLSKRPVHFTVRYGEVSDMARTRKQR